MGYGLEGPGLEEGKDIKSPSSSQGTACVSLIIFVLDNYLGWHLWVLQDKFEIKTRN